MSISGYTLPYNISGYRDQVSLYITPLSSLKWQAGSNTYELAANEVTNEVDLLVNGVATGALNSTGVSMDRYTYTGGIYTFADPSTFYVHIGAENTIELNSGQCRLLARLLIDSIRFNADQNVRLETSGGALNLWAGGSTQVSITNSICESFGEFRCLNMPFVIRRVTGFTGFSGVYDIDFTTLSVSNGDTTFQSWSAPILTLLDDGVYIVSLQVNINSATPSATVMLVRLRIDGSSLNSLAGVTAKDETYQQYRDQVFVAVNGASRTVQATLSIDVDDTLDAYLHVLKIA